MNPSPGLFYGSYRSPPPPPPYTLDFEGSANFLSTLAYSQFTYFPIEAATQDSAAVRELLEVLVDGRVEWRRVRRILIQYFPLSDLASGRIPLGGRLGAHLIFRVFSLFGIWEDDARKEAEVYLWALALSLQKLMYVSIVCEEGAAELAELTAISGFVHRKEAGGLKKCDEWNREQEHTFAELAILAR